MRVPSVFVGRHEMKEELEIDVEELWFDCLQIVRHQMVVGIREAFPDELTVGGEKLTEDTELMRTGEGGEGSG